MRILNVVKKWFDSQEHLCYLFILFFTIPNIALCYTEPMSLIAKVCNIILPLAVYYTIFTSIKNCARTFLILYPLLLLGVFQLVLLHIFGRSIIAVDMFLNMVTANPDEAIELLDNLIPVLLLVAVIYIPLLAIAIHAYVRKRFLSDKFVKTSRKRSWKALLAGIVSLLLAFIADSRYEIESDLFPVNVFYNMAQAVERTNRTNRYEITSKNFTHDAVSTHLSDRKEVYVMVVGETSRAINWSLYGYDRETNPNLSRQSGLSIFNKVLSEANTTYKSVPMLISSVNAANFDSIYYRKSILTAFKEAGFQTAYFSNQRYNRSFIDFFGKEADRFEFIKEQPSIYGVNPYDESLLKLVEEELKGTKSKQFILLHTYGSHFNYRERYPSEKKYFTPDMPFDADVKYKDKLVNAYDNSIRYTDEFLSQLIELLKKQNIDAVMLYTSDHGEDLFDDKRLLFLHSSPTPTYYQLHVPLLLWMSDSYRSNYPQYQEIARQNKDCNISSTTSFFHTMLELAGLQTPYRNDSLSVVNTLFTERPRVYLDDHNKASSLDDAGLRKEDFRMLQNKDISYLSPEKKKNRRK